MDSKENAMELSGILEKVLVTEAAIQKATGDTGIDLFNMHRAGTIIWTDPSTKEERFTPPGDPMYSTATMLAEYVILEDGTKKPWADF